MPAPLDAALLPRGPWPVGTWVAYGPAVAALIGALVLLLAFQHVVQGAVEHGEARRKAAAVHADAAWRCRDLQPPLARADCLVRLGPAP